MFSWKRSQTIILRFRTWDLGISSFFSPSKSVFLNYVYIVVGNFLVACLAGRQMGRGEGEGGDTLILARWGLGKKVGVSM